jgi:hypothetical protein
MTPRLARLAFLPAALLAAALVWRFDATGDPAAAVPAPAGTDSEMHFTLGERALLDCLKAALPQTVNVGSGLFATELTFLDPSDLVLKQDGTASCRVRVKGRTLPVDQVIKPVCASSAMRRPAGGTVSSRACRCSFGDGLARPQGHAAARRDPAGDRQPAPLRRQAVGAEAEHPVHREFSSTGSRSPPTSTCLRG